MGAKEDVAEMNRLLDQLATRCASDPAYREELLSSEEQVEALAAMGIGAAGLADVIITQGGEEADVTGFQFDARALEMGAPIGPSDNNIIILNKKSEARCLTGSGSRGRSCGGSTVVVGSTMCDNFA